MLSQIELENFKCFKERTAFPLGQLTLLTGINGCGKSTLLQSLLLMRQSIDHNENTTEILLNGSCVSLNSFNDVRNINNSRNENINFKYYFDKSFFPRTYAGVIKNSDYDKFVNLQGNIEYCLNGNLDDDMVFQIGKIIFIGKMQLDREHKNIDESLYYNVHTIYESRYNNVFKKNIFDFDISTWDDKNTEEKSLGISMIIDKLIPFSDFELWNSWNENKGVPSNNLLYDCLNFSHIHYISADRLGPQEFYLKSTINKFPNVGTKGEFTVNLLYKKRDDLVNEKLCLGEDAKTLATQTEEWLNEIFNGAKVEVPSSQSNILELLFNTSTSKDRFRPANVGFGYSYILPIVVSGLIAKEGEILIVENPEAHLHPKAQSRLAKFLAKVSSCGVQVFIESHSDHILNALRIAILDDIITHEDLSILYFQQNPEQPVVQISVQPNGGIEEWPEGFFDQMDKDFERLFGM